VKNPSFIYHRPESLADALALLSAHGDDAKILAGGQSLLPTMALRLGPPEQLIDIGRVPGLDAITASSEGATIGALVRHATAEHSTDLATYAPLVHQAMPHVGHKAIRTRGTVVGSVAHADPAAEMPAVALAADATMVAQSAGGTREIPAAEFFGGYLQTALRPDELLAEVRFPAWTADDTGAVVEVSRRHGDYALVGLVTRLRVSSGTIDEAALAFFGVGSTPVRASEAESALVGETPDPDVLATAAELVADNLEPTADVHGTAAYRRHLAGVLTRRGLTAALDQIGASA